jgi:hypothetical protein
MPKPIRRARQRLRHTRRVASTLSRIPIESRRRLAATVGLFATLFIAVGAVAATGPSSAGVRVFSVLAFVVAGLLALTGWGMLRSVRLDAAEQRLDRAVAASVAALGPEARQQVACGCGHDHDPGEMHVSGEPAAAGAECGHDGHGLVCAHDCEVCVLATMRPSPTETRAARAGERAHPA